MPPQPDEFAQVYDEHVWDVYGFFGYRVGSREEAEDLTQQTFERALRAWRRFDPRRARAKTWLLAIAHNLLVDHYRRGQRVREEPLADERTVEDHRGENPGADARLGLSPELDVALSALSDRERELIALRFGADWTAPRSLGSWRFRSTTCIRSCLDRCAGCGGTRRSRVGADPRAKG